MHFYPFPHLTGLSERGGRAYGQSMPSPSYIHQALVEIFRDRTRLAANVLQWIDTEIPTYDEASVESSDLSEIAPAEYRADAVIFLKHGGCKELGIVVEVQLRRDEDKRYPSTAIVASTTLDNDHASMYVDLILLFLSEGARRALQAMKPAGYEYQSDFARRYIAEGLAKGRQEGKVEGRAEIVLKQLALRFGPPADDVQTRVRDLKRADADLKSRNTSRYGT